MHAFARVRDPVEDLASWSRYQPRRSVSPARQGNLTCSLAHTALPCPRTRSAETISSVLHKAAKLKKGSRLVIMSRVVDMDKKLWKQVRCARKSTPGSRCDALTPCVRAHPACTCTYMPPVCGCGCACVWQDCKTMARYGRGRMTFSVYRKIG